MPEELGLSMSLLVFGVGGMFFLAVAVIFFVVVYQRRLFAQRARMQQQELDYQRNLVNASIEAQEAERKRIASDLHDEIGSMLSAMRLYVQQFTPGGDTAKNERLKDESLTILTDTITNTRRITHNLLPPSLEQFGLLAAMEDVCRKLQQSGAIDVTFDYNTKMRFELASEVALYRVLNELINNTLKHAEASTITINLLFLGRSLRIHYRDNGKGFALPAGDQTDNRRFFGLGLKSIESRVNFVEGQLAIDTAQGKGMFIEIFIPVLRQPTEETVSVETE